MQNKSVGIFGIFPFPTGSAGSNRILKFAEGFIKNDYSCVIYPLELSEDSINIDQSIEVIPLNKKKINRNKVIYIFNFYLLSLKLLLILAFSKKHDIYLYYGRKLLFVLPAIIFLKLIRKKIVVDIVEDPFLLYKGWKRLSPLVIDDLLGFLYLPKLVTHAIVISMGLRKSLLKRNVNNITLIPSLGNFDASNKDISSYNNTLEGGIVVITFISSFNPKDNPQMLKQIIHKLNNNSRKWLLNIVGRFDETEVVKQFPFLNNDNIKIYTYTSEQELNIIRENSNVFLLLRRDGLAEEMSFPTRLVEFLSFKKCILAQDVGDISMYFDNYKNIIFIDPNDKWVDSIFNNKILQDITQSANSLGQKYFDSKTNIFKLIQNLQID